MQERNLAPRHDLACNRAEQRLRVAAAAMRSGCTQTAVISV